MPRRLRPAVLSYDDLRQLATDFLREYHPARTVPIPIAPRYFTAKLAKAGKGLRIHTRTRGRNFSNCSGKVIREPLESASLSLRASSALRWETVTPMCGRLTLDTCAATLAAYFNLADLPAWSPRYEIAPTRDVLVVL